MTTHTLEIKTATIEIHVIRVDGHKMTKATFKQIPHDQESNITFSSILGWVWDDIPYVVWNVNGTIKKRSYSFISDSCMEEIKQEFPQLFIAT